VIGARAPEPGETAFQARLTLILSTGRGVATISS